MPNTLLVGGTVVDCTDGAAKKNVSVFVAGDRIAKIGPVAEVKVFADGQGRYKTIDATGKTVMPGMVDCHVHPAYGDVLSIEQLELYSTVEYRTLKGAHNLKKVLRAGCHQHRRAGWAVEHQRRAPRCRQFRSDRGAACRGGWALHLPLERHRRLHAKPHYAADLLVRCPVQHA